MSAPPGASGPGARAPDEVRLLAPVAAPLRLAGWLSVLAGALWPLQAAVLAWVVAGWAAGLDPLARALPGAAVFLLVALLRGLLEHRAGALLQGAAETVLSRERARLIRREARAPAAMGSAAVAALAVQGLPGLVPWITRYHPARLRVMILPALLLALALWQSWLVGLVLLVAGPLIPLFMALVGMAAQEASRRQLAEVGDMNALLMERLSALTDIRALGAMARASADFAARAEALRSRTMAVLRLAFLSSTVLEFFSALGVALVAVFVGFTLLGEIGFGSWGGLTLGEGLFLLLIAPEFFQPLRDLAAAWHDRAGAQAVLAELEALEGAERAGMLGQGQAAAPLPGRLSLRLEGAVAQLPGRALALPDLALGAGESLALTGPSGSGKSSALAAIAGLLPLAQGRITICGRALSNETADPWRARLAFVPQRVHLPDAPLGQWLDPRGGGEDPARALRLAGAEEIVARLPEGLDTRLGESGGGVSGGEMRRLMLARAVMAGGDLLLADEPTADLDAETAARVIAALKAIRAEGRAVLVATHDPALAEAMGRRLTLPDAEATAPRPESAVPAQGASGGAGLAPPAAATAGGHAGGGAPPRAARAVAQVARAAPWCGQDPEPDAQRAGAARDPAPEAAPLRPLWRLVPLLWGAAPAAMARGAALSVVVLLMGAALLGLSGWFITATGLAGLAGVGIAFDVFRPSAGVRFLALGRTAARYGERLLTHDAVLRALAALRLAVLRGQAWQDGPALARLRGERVLTRVISDVDALDGLLLRVILPAMAGLVTQALVTLALWWLVGPWVAAALLAAWLPASVLLLVWLARAGMAPAEAAEHAAQALRRGLIETIRDREALILAGRLAARETALESQEAASAAATRRLDRAERRAGLGLALVAGGALAAALLASAATLSAGQVGAAQAAIGVFVALALAETVLPLRRGFADLGRMAGAARRLGPLDQPTAPERPPLTEAPVLRVARPGLAFSLRPGEAMALTGASGAGKSTLLAMAAGLQPGAGVSLAGRAPQDWEESALRARVTLLPQRSALMAGTVREALTLAADHDDAALWQALEAVALADVIAARGGLEARLGEGGRGLSGGQARRLALARCLLGAPDLLLLDEPTEGLDPETARAVLSGIRRHLPRAALLVALHRGADHPIFDAQLALQGAAPRPGGDPPGRGP